MRSKVRSQFKHLSRLALVVLSVYICWRMFRGTNWEQLGAALSHLSVGTLASSTLWYLLSRFFQGLRFHALFPCGFPFPIHLGLNMASQAANIALPGRAGELLRPFYLKKWRPRLSIKTLAAGILIDKYVEAAMFLPMVAWVVFLNTGDRALIDNQEKFSPWIVAAAVAVPLVGSIVSHLKPFKNFFEHSGGSKVSTASLWSALSWLCFYLSVNALVKDSSLALAVTVAVNMAGAISGIPGGLGAYEAAYVFVVTKSGAVKEVALAQALASHTLQLVVVLVSGAFVIWKWGWPKSSAKSALAKL